MSVLGMQRRSKRARPLGYSASFDGDLDEDLEPSVGGGSDDEDIIHAAGLPESGSNADDTDTESISEDTTMLRTIVSGNVEVLQEYRNIDANSLAHHSFVHPQGDVVHVTPVNPAAFGNAPCDGDMVSQVCALTQRLSFTRQGYRDFVDFLHHNFPTSFGILFRWLASSKTKDI
eukprot:ANDGO_01596.mRNA.1 hypothetical protein